MTLSTGTKLAHYEITSQLGKGGMGEVYQAKDQKLGRDVAIKVLPEEFARDADRVVRFQREAKLLASLNHPNIAAIYGLEESDGTNFLVMELVEGNTLDDRIKSGPIPAEEALKLALQIAEALEAAHEKGVIHRDLKPTNVKVTPDGKVKVLDFGLAKAFAGEQADLNLSNSPTLSQAATQQGVILGTAAYMPPEQARGKAVDKRADIWAFGVVLFEMLTGRPLFSGEDVSSTLARVLEREPDFSALPQNVHPRIRFLLKRCLKKEPKNRYRDIGDARVDIQEVLADPDGAFAQEEKKASPYRKLLPYLAVSIILTAIVAGAVAWKLKPAAVPDDRAVMRLNYELPADQTFDDPNMALSPDGRILAYRANRQLYIKKFQETESRPIPGTNSNPWYPFFSSDGEWIGYFSAYDQKMKKVSVSGGAPFDLCRTYAPSGGHWGDNGTIVFGQPAGIMKVSSEGGEAELIIPVKEGESVQYPQILPGNEWVLCTFSDSPGPDRWDKAQIVAASIKSDDRRVLIRGGNRARYVKTGHLVYILENTLYACPFDLNTLKTGVSHPIIEGIQLYERNSSELIYCYSDDGTLAYANVPVVQKKTNLVWIDRNGKKEPVGPPPDYYGYVCLSPDGTRIALDILKDGNDDIYIWDLQQSRLERLTFHEESDGEPIWTPDGRRITFMSQRDGAFNTYWKAADGTGVVEPLIDIGAYANFPRSWSKDGKTLFLFASSGESTDIMTMSLEGDRELKPLLNEKYDEEDPQISPDGRWMAYTSDASGQDNIYVCSYPDVTGVKRQVSTDGGTEPRWSQEGQKLFYRNGDTIRVVSYTAEPVFKVEKTEIFLRGVREQDLPGSMYWDINSDGSKILTVKESDDNRSYANAAKPKINIILNWFEELKQKVPVH